MLVITVHAADFPEPHVDLDHLDDRLVTLDLLHRLFGEQPRVRRHRQRQRSHGDGAHRCWRHHQPTCRERHSVLLHVVVCNRVTVTTRLLDRWLLIALVDVMVL